MNLVRNVIINPFAICNGNQFMSMYFDTLQLVAKDRFNITLSLAYLLLIVREVSFVIIMLPFVSSWTRFILVDLVEEFQLPKLFNLVVFVGYFHTFYFFNVLFRKCFNNQFSRLPYQVLLKKNIDCIDSKYYKQELVVDKIVAFHRKCSKMVQLSYQNACLYFKFTTNFFSIELNSVF